MLIAGEIRRAGDWNETSAADTVILDFDGRHRRRHAMTGEAGLSFLLDLPQTTALREGDGLVLIDGRTVRVKSQPERLMQIAASDFPALVRIAWHLGNRHLPTQLVGNRLRIRHDHVIKGMVEGLGGTVTDIDAPFDPEGGAFAQGAADAQGHSYTQAHPHRHNDEHHEHSH